MYNTSYLSLASWLFVPKNVDSVKDYEVVVYANGEDPFDQNTLKGLTGSAIYSGDAMGLRMHRPSDAADPVIKESLRPST